MKQCAVQYSSDGSISVGESVMLTVSGDEEMKNILVSWSHQVGTAPVTFTPFMHAHMLTYTHAHTHT